MDDRRWPGDGPVAARGGAKTDALILAGGRGERLRPWTDATPKPMLQVGGKPILERLIEYLRAYGVRRITVAVHYRAGDIMAHFEDSVGYIVEEGARGTAGALGQIPTPTAPLLMLNGDLISDINIRALAQFHADQRAALTVATWEIEVPSKFGILDIAEPPLIAGVREKAPLRVPVSAGIYVVDPVAFAYLPRQRAYDATDLIAELRAYYLRVVSFPIRDSWLAVDTPEDLERARALFAEKVPA